MQQASTTIQDKQISLSSYQQSLTEVTTRLSILHEQTDSIHLRIAVLKNNLQLHSEQNQIQVLSVSYISSVSSYYRINYYPIKIN